ncbi:MAG: sigma-70 family RNA polymerase sigma factor [Acidobacteriota bacterium]
MEEKEREEIEASDFDADHGWNDAGAGAKEKKSEASLARLDTTIAPTDTLQKYIAEVRKFPVLTPEEEIVLAKRFKESGDREAALRLITANLMLVVKISLKFRRACQNVLDCIQEGNLGLLQAAHKFDPDLGVRFPTYATWWIRAYILKYILDNIRLVRVGTTNVRRRLIHNLQEEKRRLEDLGFTVGTKLLAERFGATEQDVIDVQQSLESRDVSLNAPVSDESSAPRADFIASGEELPDEKAARGELEEIVKGKLKIFKEKLNKKELAILEERILSDEQATLQEIGKRFGITREAVRQTEERLKKKLRKYLENELGTEIVHFIK